MISFFTVKVSLGIPIFQNYFEKSNFYRNSNRMFDSNEVELLNDDKIC